MTRESTIQTHILEYLRHMGAYSLNVGGSAVTATGTPDILCCYKGHFVALEIKKPHGSYGATTAQRIRIKQIQKAGGVAGLVTSVQGVARLLKQIGEQDA